MVVTLLYAVTEWKRSVNYTTQEFEYNLYGRLLEMDLLLAGNEELADIVLRAGSDPRSLTSPERARFPACENIFYNTWNALYDARESGLIGPRQFGLWEASFITESASWNLTRIGNKFERRLWAGKGTHSAKYWRE